MNRIVYIVAALTVMCGVAAAQAVTLSPAVVPLGGHAGQSWTQHLTIQNSSTQALAFKLIAKDVVVRDGERLFVDAGELPVSIAATAVFSRPDVTLRPGDEQSVDVTLTLPARATHRAIVVLFKGTNRLASGATVAIGSLITFDLAGRASISPGEIAAAPPTASTNASFTLTADNDGSEPSILRGAIAVVGAEGVFAGKMTLQPRRLLPGEHAMLVADYPGELPRGRYLVVATIESGKRSWTRRTELVVP